MFVYKRLSRLLAGTLVFALLLSTMSFSATFPKVAGGDPYVGVTALDDNGPDTSGTSGGDVGNPSAGTSDGGETTPPTDPTYPENQDGSDAPNPTDPDPTNPDPENQGGSDVSNTSDDDETTSDDDLLGMLMPLSEIMPMATDVPYINPDGSPATTPAGVDVKEIASDTTTWNTTGGAWYVAQSEVTISSRVTVTGTVNLILEDDAHLTVEGGIQVQGTGNSLIIWAQSTGDWAVVDGGGDVLNEGGSANVGRLTATAAAATSSAGIGGTSNGSTTVNAGGTVTINGGVVTATGGSGNLTGSGATGGVTGGGAGIGGSGSAYEYSTGGTGGTITINNGKIIATGGTDGPANSDNKGGTGAGIGGGGGTYTGGAGGNISILGGHVTATGGADTVTTAAGPGGGAGIGGGGGGKQNGTTAGGGASGTIIIRDAVVIATSPVKIHRGAGGAGIGGGGSGRDQSGGWVSPGGSVTSITIERSVVIAQGSDGSGIGGAHDRGNYGADIGSGGTLINATGTNTPPSGGTLTITDSTVTLMEFGTNSNVTATRSTINGAGAGTAEGFYNANSKHDVNITLAASPASQIVVGTGDVELTATLHATRTSGFANPSLVSTAGLKFVITPASGTAITLPATGWSTLTPTGNTTTQGYPIYEATATWTTPALGAYTVTADFTGDTRYADGDDEISYQIVYPPLTGTPTITIPAPYALTAPVAGLTLTAVTTGLSVSTGFSYQWQRGTTNIDNATGSTYTLTADDVGQPIRVVVSSDIASGTATSAATGNVLAANATIDLSLYGTDIIPAGAGWVYEPIKTIGTSTLRARYIIQNGADVTITGDASAGATDRAGFRMLLVAPNAKDVKITLDEATIDPRSYTTAVSGVYFIAPLFLSDGAEVTLELKGESVLAAFNAPGIFVYSNAKLDIQSSDGTGILHAVGNGNGTGIGGSGNLGGVAGGDWAPYNDIGNAGDSGTITIESGTIYASANGTFNAAGIGAGPGGGASTTAGTITINGGTVYAMGAGASIGASSGAGIGGAGNSSNGTITINGGTVTAIGANNGNDNSAAGIGGGGGGRVGSVTIKGDATVIAIPSPSGGTGIGGGATPVNMPEGAPLVFTTNASGGTQNAGALILGTVTRNTDSFPTAYSGTMNVASILGTGSAYTLVNDFTTPNKLENVDFDFTLNIEEDVTLTLAQNITLTNNGRVNNFGTVNHSLHNAAYGTWAGNWYYVPGAAVNAPTLVEGTKTASAITVVATKVASTPVTNTQTIEYARNTTNTAPTAPTAWQDTPAFTGMSEYTQYYFFARSKESPSTNTAYPNYFQGDPSGGTAIRTADETPPTGEIAIKSRIFDDYAAHTSYAMFFKDEVTVEIEADDMMSGVESIEYFTSASNLPENTTDWDAQTWTTVSDDSVSFDVEEEFKGFVYVRITDNEDNSIIIRSGGIVVYGDAAASTASVSHTIGTASKTATVTLNGNTIAGVHDGTKALVRNTDYTLASDTGNVITLTATYLDSLTAGGYTLTVSYNPQGEPYATHADNDVPGTTTFALTVVKPITVNATDINYAGKEYDGTTDATDAPATFTLTSASGIETGHTVTASYTSASFGNASVGPGTVTFSGLSLGGTGSGYYSLTSTTATKSAEIEKATPPQSTVSDAISFIQLQAGSSTVNLPALLPALTVPASYGTVSYSFTNIDDGDSILTAPTATGTVTNPSAMPVAVAATAVDGESATITVTATSDNYTTITITITVNIINKTTVTIGGLSITDRAYNAQPLAYTGTATFTAGGSSVTPSVATLTVLYEGVGNAYSSSTAPTNAGDYKVTATLNSDPAYFGTWSDTFTIEKRQLTITGGTVTAKTYDTTATATVTALEFTNLVQGQSLAITTDYSVGTPAFNSADAGTNKTVSGTAALQNTATANNYALASGGAYTLTGKSIGKANPVATFPTSAALTFGQSLSQAQLTGQSNTTPGGFAFDEPQRQPTVAQSGNFLMIFTPTDVTNFNVLSQNVAVTVSPAAIAAAQLTVTAPALGETPLQTVNGTGNFSLGTVAWTPSATFFAGSTSYTASVVLTANTNYTFTSGLSTATINGQTATVANNNGATATLSYAFAALGAATVPAAPGSFTATAGNAQATLGWAAPNNGGAAITHYEVSSDGDNWTSAGLETSYVMTGLANGTQYTFKVRAVNSVGNGSEASANATPRTPRQPDPRNPSAPSGPSGPAPAHDPDADTGFVEGSSNTHLILSRPGAWTGSGSAAWRIDASPQSFIRLLIGGVEIDSSNYTVTSGSTIITLRESYLRTLPDGIHTFRAVFSGGSVTFTWSADLPQDDEDAQPAEDNDAAEVVSIQPTADTPIVTDSEAEAAAPTPSADGRTNTLWIIIAAIIAAVAIICIALIRNSRMKSRKL